MSAALTNGFLPAAPFGHLEPTALGVVDIEHPATVSIMQASAGPPRDALLLVRLHREPLGLVHVPDASATADTRAVLALVREQLGARIREHELSIGCSVDAPACPGLAPPPLPGSVAVIIPTGGRVEQLDRCLRSLVPSVASHVEIIVVDNRPAVSETRQLLSRWSAHDKRVRYVAEQRPGSSVARNRGIAETRAEFLAFTDDDVVVDEGWLPWLLAPFSDPKVNVATGLVLPLELGTIAQKRFEQYAGFSKGVERHSYDLGAHSARERLLYPYWGGVFGSGNSMAFRREELARAGGFDPTLGAGSLALAGADIEAMSAAILRGGRLVYEPRSLCWHEHRRDDAALARQLFNYGAGFTAILTKGLLRDRRFLASAARSVPVALRLRRHQSGGETGAAGAALPEELAALQRKGMLRGPGLYLKSVRWAKRLRLDEVIRGG
jgi:O-antigen biosynthesis protein